MLNIKVITLVLLLVGSAIVGGVGTGVYINSWSEFMNCNTPSQNGMHIQRSGTITNTGRNKEY